MSKLDEEWNKPFIPPVKVSIGGLFEIMDAGYQIGLKQTDCENCGFDRAIHLGCVWIDLNFPRSQGMPNRDEDEAFAYSLAKAYVYWLEPTELNRFVLN